MMISLPMEYSIRTASIADLVHFPAIEQAATQLFCDTPYAFLINSPLVPVSVFQQWLQEGQGWVAVTAEDHAVGFAFVCDVDGTAYLRELDVHPQYGRQGIGRALVETVCLWAQQQHYDTVTLSTFHDVAWNAPFYQKLGFQIWQESELSTAFQQIRALEAERNLPLDRRVIMWRSL